MEIFLLTFIIMLLAFTGLATGVLLGRKPIQGSCGGVQNTSDASCACQTPCEAKQRKLREAETT